MKLGEQQAAVLCQHNTLAKVVNEALGGTEPEREDITASAPTPEAAIAAINSALNFG